MAASQRYASSGFAATSTLVSGMDEIEAATSVAVEKLSKGLGGEKPTCILWFAKGYGDRAAPTSALLKEQLGNQDTLVLGSASEAGIIGAGEEVRSERFALAALAMTAPGLRAYPFHAEHLGILPELRRGGQWARCAEMELPPSVLAFCTMPVAGRGNDPQGWLELLDRALARDAGGSSASHGRLPVVVGGMPVSNHVHLDGESYDSGGFGIVLEALDHAMHLDAVVCQGAVPFGPWLKITGVGSDHVITSLEDRNPREVLMPLLHGPQVPGEGHTMAGVFVDPLPVMSLPTPASSADVAAAALGGRPSCLVRPLHQFTAEGYLVISPLSQSSPYAEGMTMQLHCHNPEHALQELRMRAEHDMAMHNGQPPDAAVIVSCGARGDVLYGENGVESRLLSEIWQKDVPTVGFFAGGEIGPVGLKTYLHGYTTSCLLIRRR